MNKTTLLLLACTLIVPVRADDYAFKQAFSETHPLRADGTFSLSNVNGSVEVRTWDRAEVRIAGEKSARSDDELKLIELTIEPRPDRVDVHVRLPRRSGWWWFAGSSIRGAVKFTITVPADARLDPVRTVNGSVIIDGARRAVRASAVNGSVKVSALAGDVKLTTTNGGVDAKFAALAADAHIELRCVNGGISVAVPKDANAELDASVVNGHVECELPVRVSGRVSGRSVHGTIGAGGATLKASTVNGGVRIRGS